MSVATIITLLAFHWISDFVFQTGEMAANKSSANGWLTGHCFVYSLVFGLLLSPSAYKASPDSVEPWLMFMLITFVCHWITDYFTSRVVKQKFEVKEYYTSLPNMGAFTIIGFDQLLHFIQIFVTYKYLFL